ncbi:hypothetical protein SSX86_014862 [Deinandra increscens subsp. villosa]|uniref:Uncharacterized protein n=1 Tax=Deinandra increscens subsp. villosa TaxID=3103831 RepID=A0AAP0D2Z2_9ASTR
MRCKRHGTDLSSIVGVCASCLRERLFRLILAQEQAQAHSLEPNQCNSNMNPPLRRSVSPYISRAESVKSVNPVVVTVQRPYNNPRLIHSQSDKRFYSSPQIAINTGGCIGGSSSYRKQSSIRFPSISNLFRSSSRNADPDSNRIDSNRSDSRGGCGGGARLSSRSWFSNVLPGAGGRQKSKGSHIDEASTAVARRRRCFRDRGMSPVRSSDDEFSDGTSDCQSAESCKQTPMKTPSTVRRGGGQKSVTDLIFCSLVHASPNRLLNLKGRPPVGGGFSGETRTPAVPHLAYTKSFSGNRSRKLADFGRCDLNR